MDGGGVRKVQKSVTYYFNGHLIQKNHLLSNRIVFTKFHKKGLKMKKPRSCKYERYIKYCTRLTLIAITKEMKEYWLQKRDATKKV